jgi:hypothetical protein
MIADGDYGLVTEFVVLAASDTLAGCMVPVKRTNMASVMSPTAFIDSDLTPGLGLKGDGSSKWVATGLDVALITQDSNAMMLGVQDVGSGPGSLYGVSQHRFMINASGFYAHRNFRAAEIADTVAATAPAILYGVRRGATDWELFKDNVSLGVSALASVASPSVFASLFRSQATSGTFSDARLWCHVQFGASAPGAAAQTRIYNRMVTLRGAIV